MSRDILFVTNKACPLAGRVVLIPIHFRRAHKLRRMVDRHVRSSHRADLGEKSRLLHRDGPMDAIPILHPGLRLAMRRMGQGKTIPGGENNECRSTYRIPG
jgi:hypothetical protein